MKSYKYKYLYDFFVFLFKFFVSLSQERSAHPRFKTDWKIIIN